MAAGEIVVVGAGAVGLAAALRLRQTGAAVRVLDAGTVGGACSGANAGWVCPSLSLPVPAPGATAFALRALGRSDAPVALAPAHLPALAPWLARFAASSRPERFRAGAAALAALNARTLALYDELVADGVDCELSDAGIVCAFLDPALAARAHASVATLVAAHGLTPPGPLLDGGELRALEPGLSAGVRAGFVCRGDRHLRPEALTAGLAQQLRARGVAIEEGVHVTGFRTDERAVAAVLTSRGTRPAAKLLLAAGAGTRALAERLGARLPLEVATGYCATVSAPRPLAHAISCGDRKVACTPQGGHVRVAGILELSGERLRVDDRRVRGMVRAATEYLGGGFAAAAARGPESLAVGQRTMTPDGLPILDRLDPWSNAFVATGHAMLGITLAPAGGEAIAAFMTGGERPAVLEPFRARR